MVNQQSEVTLREITAQTVRSICRLTVGAEQQMPYRPYPAKNHSPTAETVA